MKKLLLTVLIGLASTSVFADYKDWHPKSESGKTKTWHSETNDYDRAIFIEGAVYDSHFANSIDSKSEGFAIGFEKDIQLSNPSWKRSGIGAKFEYLKNKDFDASYYELQGKGYGYLIDKPKFYTLWSLGVGVALIDSKQYEGVFLTLPIELEAGFNLTNQVSLYGGVGYKYNVEIPDMRTRCKDGRYTNSTGSGTCSHHGGIDRNYIPDDEIGNFHGLTYKAGIKYRF